MRVEEMAEFIPVARGERSADLVLRGARIVNTLSGDIHEGNVAVFNGRIAGIGNYDAKEILELDGGYLIPGLVDGHVHIESSMVAPPQYARGVLPRGTTSVFADPHEIANVMGIDGVRLMLRLSDGLPLKVFVMVPSCVPSTDMETAGAELSARDIASLLDEERVVGLAEMMNYPGVLFCVPSVLEKIEAVGDRVIDGHAPGLSGRDLNAYIGVGISSDHECTIPEEAIEKLRAGMFIMIREGTGARNLNALLPIITPENSRRIMFASDDLHLPDLIGRGHIDYMVRRAIEFGIDPVAAIRIATLNAAERFGRSDIGAIAPGRRADMVWTKELKELRPEKVWADGKLVAVDGEAIEAGWMENDIIPSPTMNPAPFGPESFRIPAEKGARAHIIGVISGQIITEHIVEEIPVKGGFAVADASRNILKLAVIERHKATGNIGLGFVRGMGIEAGALASSVAHDSHNLIVVGTNDDDMNVAAKAVVEMAGGFACARSGNVLEKLPLPLAGLMSTSTMERVVMQLDRMKRISSGLGSNVEDPFMLMGFLALPVIPKLKLTDMGLVDVEKFRLIGLLE